MQTIDLNKIIEESELDAVKVAEHLFPTNKYPRHALKRVLNGDANLDADQISRLSGLTGRSIASLYSGGGWKGVVKKDKHIFTHGEYRAELNTETWVTEIFHNESLFHDSVIHTGAVSLSEYLAELDRLIAEHKQKTNA